jgi:hypothetical protein
VSSEASSERRLTSYRSFPTKYALAYTVGQLLTMQGTIKPNVTIMS